AYLPRYAPWAARLAPLINLRNQIPILAELAQRLFGLSAERKLPSWSTRPYRAANFSLSAPGGGEGRGEVGERRGSGLWAEPPHPPPAPPPRPPLPPPPPGGAGARARQHGGG